MFDHSDSYVVAWGVGRPGEHCPEILVTLYDWFQGAPAAPKATPLADSARSDIAGEKKRGKGVAAPDPAVSKNKKDKDVADKVRSRRIL